MPRARPKADWKQEGKEGPCLQTFLRHTACRPGPLCTCRLGLPWEFLKSLPEA